MTALVETSRLTDRLDWDLSDAEKADAEFAIDYLSDLALDVAGAGWQTPEQTPSLVKNTILAAAKRYMTRSEGYITSRAADETVGWGDIGDKAGSPFFTKAEEQTIRRSTARKAFGTIRAFAWGSSKNRVRPDGNTGYVPTDTTKFPYYASESDVW